MGLSFPFFLFPRGSRLTIFRASQFGTPRALDIWSVGEGADLFSIFHLVLTLLFFPFRLSNFPMTVRYRCSFFAPRGAYLSFSFTCTPSRRRFFFSVVCFHPRHSTEHFQPFAPVRRSSVLLSESFSLTLCLVDPFRLERTKTSLSIPLRFAPLIRQPFFLVVFLSLPSEPCLPFAMLGDLTPLWIAMSLIALHASLSAFLIKLAQELPQRGALFYLESAPLLFNKYRTRDSFPTPFCSPLQFIIKHTFCRPKTFFTLYYVNASLF